MVAIIKTGNSLRRILNYNENKVKEGVAECIGSANYAISHNKLSEKQKLNRLLNQAILNQNVTRNSVHISLNFDPSEQQISQEKLKGIAESYMQKIGFGEQPYLVYRHHDAGHPHLHIVILKVRADGSRIDTQNIGRNQSEKARKEIEIEYGLIKAEDQKKQPYKLNEMVLQKLQYGRTESRRAIAKVLEAILKNYRYSSLPELNAVLNLYNVHADRGSEQSRTYINEGLMYHILDGKGNKVGVPIKASDFYNKPTLPFLEAKFQENDTAKQPFKSRVRNAIDLALFKQKDFPLRSCLKLVKMII